MSFYDVFKDLLTEDRTMRENTRGGGAKPGVAIPAEALAEFGGYMTPGMGVVDAGGRYPALSDPEQDYYPGIIENVREGSYGMAGMQGLGLLGDAMTYGGGAMAATGAGLPAGAALMGLGSVAKVPGAVSKAARTLRKVKVSDDKKLSGAPLGVTNPQGEAARRRNYMNMMEEGAGGRNWYDDAGQSIRFHAGDDVDLANRTAENFAALSASNTVKGNTAMSLRGHNQAMAGAQIETGRFPGRQSKEVADIYSSSHQATGQKRAPFADQLAIGGDFYVKPSGQGHRGVHDIWDGEAWGYVNPDGSPVRRGFSPAEHNWMDSQMNRALGDANAARLAGFDDWTAGRGQAATWTGAKIRAGDIGPSDAAFSYADAIPQNYAQQSRESVPGRTTEQLDGLLDAPLGVRQGYDDEVTRIVYDDQGRDRISMGYGLLTGESFPGPGVFEGRVNPGRQGQVAVGRAKGSNLMDDASVGLLDASESAYGLIGAQDAAAWHSFSPNKVPIKHASRVEIPLGGVVDDDAMVGISGALDALDVSRRLGFTPIAAVPSPTGVRLINIAPDVLPNEEFVQATRGINSQLGADPRQIRWGHGSNNYIERPEYFDLIDTLETQRAQAGLPSGFDASMPDIARQWSDLDKAMGFPKANKIETLRKAIADDGWKGVRALKSKGLLSAAAVAALAPFFIEAQDGDLGS